MRAQSTVQVVAALAILVTFGVAGWAQIPLQMNYQVMLTNDMDEPLADQSVELVFSIYDEASGGSQWWSETHNEMTNSIGVVSVVLGQMNPLGIDFSSPLWLQIEADGEVMSPRRPLTATPYAMRAQVADTAESAGHATDSDNLGGTPASDYALDDDLYQPGTINTPSNPLEWTKLKSVPAGFADGTDDVGTGVGGGGTADYVPKFTGATSIGNSVIYETGGQVAIGTTTAEGKLTLENAGDVATLAVTNTSSSGVGYPVLTVERTEDMSSGSMLSIDATESSTGGLFLDCARVSGSGFYRAFWVDLDGGIYSIDEMDITSDTDRVIDAYSHHESGDTRVISGVYGPGGGLEFDARGVYGESTPQDWWGYGGDFLGGYIGAAGRVEPTSNEDYYGLFGDCTGGSGENYGVHGSAFDGASNYGVYGIASGGPTNWAGWFHGDVNVTGVFYNPASALVIDHPLDPEEQYLRQPAVHSDEMKNVYDGTVVLDAAGEATVELPDWFEALNTDFRYQLTAIGAPGPNLYVADEVAGSSFRIAGGEPGMKVSWQVTGVRADAYARHRPLVVEQEKGPKERARYLTPEAHGAPRTAGIGYSKGRKTDD